jgi:predicted SnoaL-like aldol condensation-catalyzing enzyme
VTTHIFRRTAMAACIAVLLASSAVSSAGTPAAAADSDIDTDKRIATDFTNLAYNEKQPQQAADRYLAPGLVQHDPALANGARPWARATASRLRQYPRLRETVLRALAQDHLVVLHVLQKRTPEDRGTAAFEVYRLDAGRIAEHWTLKQTVPARSANGHTLTDGTTESPWTQPEWLQHHTDDARDFTDLVFNQGRAQEAVGKYLAPDLVQHDPDIGDGPQAYLDFARSLPVRNSGDQLRIQRIVADMKFVFVHSVIPSPRGPVAMGDLYRVDFNGKFAEHWSVIQQMPKRAARGNTPN